MGESFSWVSFMQKTRPSDADARHPLSTFQRFLSCSFEDSVGRGGISIFRLGSCWSCAWRGICCCCDGSGPLAAASNAGAGSSGSSSCHMALLMTARGMCVGLVCVGKYSCWLRGTSGLYWGNMDLKGGGGPRDDDASWDSS